MSNTPTTDPVQTDFEGEEMREKIAELIRHHVYADATGLSPAVIGYHLGGFEEAADAVLAALRSSPEGGDQGAEAMQTELRPFAEGEGEGLDEVVIYGSHIVHAETMSDTALWIGIHDQAGGLVHIWVNAVRRKGKIGIVMTATDEGERGTIKQGSALPPSPLRTQSNTGGRT